MGFQEENAGTVPSEIPCKPVVYLDGTASRHKPTEHHIQKTDILLTNDSLAPKQFSELQPSSPASGSLAGEKQKQREKLH